MKDIAKNLKEISKALQKGHFLELKKKSNALIERAVEENNSLKAKTAMISYSLFKLSSKEHIVKSKKWNKVKNQIVKGLEKAALLFMKGKKKEAEEAIEKIAESISLADEELGRYVQSIFEKARVKLASTAYAMGLSLTKAAELTGAEKASLMKYIGSTKIHDEKGIGLGIKERLEKFRGE